MKYVLCLICLSLPGWAQVSGIKDLVRDPALSFRCKALLKDRNSKVQTRQRLEALVKRNQSLLRKTPTNKQTIRKKLEINDYQLNNYLRLTKLRVQSMEEDIIRKGCPGISL